MQNLERLRVFYDAARAESFTKAAEILHLTQSGVSKHILAMEEDLGTPLFERLGRRVALTDAGEILYETAQEVLASVASAEQRIRELDGLRRGKLRVGASFPVGLYLLPRLLATFRNLYPAIEVTLAIATTANIEAKVVENKVDFGLVSAAIQHPKLRALRFMRDELAVIVPPQHRWANRKTIRAEELAAETLIFAARGAGARATVEERLKEKGITLPNILDFVNIEGVKHAVEAGLGISVQPRVAIQREVEAGSLVAVRLADMDPEIQYVYICRKKQTPSRAQKAFVEMLVASV